eukprot:3493390-Rhodomonas_salina.3
MAGSCGTQSGPGASKEENFEIPSTLGIQGYRPTEGQPRSKGTSIDSYCKLLGIPRLPGPGYPGTGRWLHVQILKQRLLCGCCFRYRVSTHAPLRSNGFKRYRVRPYAPKMV